MSLILILTITLAFIASVNATVHFKVLCSISEYSGTGVTVYIDGNPNPMKSLNNDILWEFDYEGTPKEYYYEVTNTTQNELTLFKSPRTWDPTSTTTFYEVFGRQRTIGDDIIKTIPRLFDPLEGYDKFSQLFQEGELVVINLKLSNQVYTELISLAKNEDVKFQMDFDLYTPYEKYQFTNASLSLSGQGSKELEKKPYKIDLSENEADKSNSEIFDRKEFKLRSLRYDESYIKNKLAMDIGESLGVPVAQSGICRLYINNSPYGLYEITDMYKKKFVRRFFKVEKTGETYNYGSLYKGVSHEYPAYLYSDFPGSTIQELYESVVPPTAGYDPHQDIQKMIAWAEALQPTATEAEIEKQFDIDMFLKYMAIEFLLCHWDGYLGNGNNFFIYVEPNNGKYHFFSYDFDLTFGKYCKATMSTLDTYTHDIIEDESNRKYGTGPKREPLLWTKIINNPAIKPKFEELLKNILTNLFNLEALGPRIQYFYDFYKVDMYWDVNSFNTIQTQNFNKGHELPTIENIDAQFSDQSEPSELKGYIKARSEFLKQTLNIPAFKSEGKGTVGGKLMTIGKATENKN
jgi:spore coat protein CotH